MPAEAKKQTKQKLEERKENSGKGIRKNEYLNVILFFNTINAGLGSCYVHQHLSPDYQSPDKADGNLIWMDDYGMPYQLFYNIFITF